MHASSVCSTTPPSSVSLGFRVVGAPVPAPNVRSPNVAGVLSVYSPDQFCDLQRAMSEIRSFVGNDAFPFRNSIYPACALNLGPQTVTKRHNDPANKAGSWCIITAAGDFDYRRGGHLILWDLKLIIEFPAGSTIAIPSALLEHSNTLIQDGEHRYSFTQYVSGGLFRWIELEHLTEKTCKLERPGLYRKVRARDTERFKEALGLYSTLDDLGAILDCLHGRD